MLARSQQHGAWVERLVVWVAPPTPYCLLINMSLHHLDQADFLQ